MSRRVDSADERGMVTVLLALMLVVMLGLSALVVDLGIGRVGRRNSQNGVDAAAAASAYELSKGDRTSLPPSATTVAHQYGDENLGTLDWGSCTDSGSLDGTGTCVSFQGLLHVRVRVPTRTIQTLFGSILGVSQLQTSAVAEAILGGGNGGVLPFGLANPTPQTTVCLKTDPTKTSPCDGPNAGNFGFLDSPRYGSGCNGQVNSVLAANIDQGIDHQLTVWTPGDPQRDDGSACSDPSLRPADTMDTKTGNVAQALDDGLVNGGDGRLTRAPLSPTTVYSGNGPNLDGKPLWQFMTSSDASWPATCRVSITTSTQMAQCLADFGTSGSTVPLFDSSLGTSLRFGFTPELIGYDTANGGSGSYPIYAFDPVFLEAVYFGCNANRCTATYYPGEPALSTGIPVATNKTADALTALRIPSNALPQDLRKTSPDPFVAKIVTLVR